MLGTVAMLRRYPVKSLLGEEVAASDVTRAGLAGDRRLALLSRQTGKIASAKYPRLWRNMGTFFDFAAVHLLTTATLDRIAELSPYRRASLERYRPNVVIRTEAAGFTENDWLDRDLRIGEDLVLRVIARAPRCAVPTLAHGPLPRDADALRILARHNRVTALPGRTPEPCAGVYADVLTPGRIRTGDPVRLT